MLAHFNLINRVRDLYENPTKCVYVKRSIPDMMDKNPSCSLLQDLGRFSAQNYLSIKTGEEKLNYSTIFCHFYLFTDTFERNQGESTENY